MTVRRVLVVDDDAPSRLLFSTVLRHLGVADVVAVEDGEAAVAAFQAGGFDLVLMDALMPGLDGYGATRLIRAHEARVGAPPVPVIGTSAQEDEPTRCRSLAAGMTDVLAKPVEMARVKALLARWAPGD